MPEAREGHKGPRAKRRKSVAKPAWGQPVPGQYEKLRDYYSGDKSGFPENNPRVSAYQQLPKVNSPGGIAFNVAPQTTISAKSSSNNKKDKPKKKPGKGRAGGTGMMQMEPTTLEQMRGGGGGGGSFYDPYTDLPSIQDVQSESLGILDELVQGMLFDSEGESYDYQSHMEDIASGIRKAYAADIKAIRGNIKDTRKDTKKARKDINRLYKGLAQAYGRDAQAADASGQAAVAQAQQIANEASGNLQSTAQNINSQEAQLLKDLGVQAAAPDIIPDATGVVDQGVSRIQQTGASAATAQDQMSTANENYFNRGRAGARMEGADRKADLTEGLTDYVRGQRDEIRGLKGQRARDVAESNAAIESQAAEMQAAQDAETWTRLMDYMGMRSDIEQQNFDNALDTANFNWDSRMDREDVLSDRRKFKAGRRDTRFEQNANVRDYNFNIYKEQQRALEAAAGKRDEYEAPDDLPDTISEPLSIISRMVPGRNNKTERSMAGILDSMRKTPEFQVGSFRNPGDGKMYKMTPERAAAMAEQVGRQKGLSNEQIRILRLAAMASV